MAVRSEQQQAAAASSSKQHVQHRPKRKEGWCVGSAGESQVISIYVQMKFFEP
jgi:hypothetical protein